MYRVTVETAGQEYVLHDIHSQDEQIYDDELSEEMGKTATFKFTMAPNHPYIDKIVPLSSEIRIYKDGIQIFWGRAITPSADIYNTQTVECVGGLSYLADSLQAPFTVSGPGTAFLQQILAAHNSQVEANKQLQLGNITVSIRDTERTLEAYTDTLSVLTTLLVDNYGGYLRVREDSGVRYLDYLTNYGGTNSQEVRFGENILDLSSEIDASDIATVLIPEGAEVDGERVNITTVNGGVNYIQDAQAVARWGKIWAYVQFDDITEPAVLLEAAQDYLAEVTTLPRSIDLTAFDLSLTDTSIEALELGYWTNFISTPHNLSGTYLLQKLVRHLTAPQNDKVTFGIVKNTISGQTANTDRVVYQQIEQVKQTVGKEMDEKIENATKLITGGAGGYFVIGLNENGQPNETYWMDAPSTEEATNVLRINQNGIGFSKNGINGPYTNAWTIDGNLVASFITSGTMLADRIRGGTLEIGGTGTAANGVITVKNASGTVIAQIDQNGITINQGSINLGNGAFRVTQNGVMTLNGTNNSSSIGCEVLSAGHAEIQGDLNVGSEAQFTGDVTMIDMYARDIQCNEIYSSVAGEWWSDRRLKRNIRQIPAETCLEIVRRLRPVSFVFKDSGIPAVGFIAQDVQKILSKMHSELPIVNIHKGYFCIPYAVYVALLAGAVQEQEKEIKKIRREIKKDGRHQSRNQ